MEQVHGGVPGLRVLCGARILFSVSQPLPLAAIFCDHHNQYRPVPLGRCVTKASCQRHRRLQRQVWFLGPLHMPPLRFPGLNQSLPWLTCGLRLTTRGMAVLRGLFASPPDCAPWEGGGGVCGVPLHSLVPGTRSSLGDYLLGEWGPRQVSGRLRTQTQAPDSPPPQAHSSASDKHP